MSGKSLFQLLLSEMGFDEGFVKPLRRDYLMPLSRLLYPEWVGKGLDSHRAFVVKYAMEDDVELSYHFDNAEVTLNVCLGERFTGGDLYFGSMRTVRRLTPFFPSSKSCVCVCVCVCRREVDTPSGTPTSTGLVRGCS